MGEGFGCVMEQHCQGYIQELSSLAQRLMVASTFVFWNASLASFTSMPYLASNRSRLRSS